MARSTPIQYVTYTRTRVHVRIQAGPNVYARRFLRSTTPDAPAPSRLIAMHRHIVSMSRLYTRHLASPVPSLPLTVTALVFCIPATIPDDAPSSLGCERLPTMRSERHSLGGSLQSMLTNFCFVRGEICVGIASRASS